MANGALGIGRIFGIAIELDWIFIIFILLFLLFFPPITVLIIVVLFLCVLIHELSHSVTSIRNGIAIRKIVLTPLGGMSVIDETNIDPKVEFNISVVGPIANLFLGGLFGIAVLFTPAGILTFIAQELFLINIILGISNIVPAFPMDGARVLRSYLERRMDTYSATMATVKVSKYCIALILVGTLSIFVIPNSYGTGYKEFLLLIDLFIAYFLYLGTNAERDSAIMRKDTEGMHLSDAISRDYALIDCNAKPSAIYKLIKAKKEHIILSKTPRGTFYLVDIFNKERFNKAKQVKDLLIAIPNIPASIGIADALPRIESSAYRVAVVVKGKTLVGIATGNHINAFVTLHMMNKNVNAS